MSLFLEDDYNAANDRSHDTHDHHHHRMSAEFSPGYHNPPMPRFASNSVPLDFGSVIAFQAPPFLSTSGPIPPSLPSPPPIADSPDSQNTVNIPSTIDSVFDPETPTPIETRIGPNIYSSSSSRSPSISSVPSLQHRSTFSNLPPLKIPASDAPLPVSFDEGPLPQPNNTYPFMPHLPNSVFEKSRHTCTANASTQTDPDEQSIMVSDGLKEIEEVRAENVRLKKELAEARAAHAGTMRKVEAYFESQQEEAANKQNTNE